MSLKVIDWVNTPPPPVRKTSTTNPLFFMASLTNSLHTLVMATTLPRCKYRGVQTIPERIKKRVYCIVSIMHSKYKMGAICLYHA